MDKVCSVLNWRAEGPESVSAKCFASEGASEGEKCADTVGLQMTSLGLTFPAACEAVGGNVLCVPCRTLPSGGGVTMWTADCSHAAATLRPMAYCGDDRRGAVADGTAPAPDSQERPGVSSPPPFHRELDKLFS